MFERSATPRVFALPPGVDFPAALIRGLTDRLVDAPPEALARVHLIVNTRRMARRLRDIFDAGPPRLLPRISLVTDLGDDWRLGDLPTAVPPLRRRLELAQLIARLLDSQPDLAARDSVHDLADSLSALMDEMQDEDVDGSVLRRLDVSNLSAHWARALSFIGIAEEYIAASGQPDPQARQRAVIERLAQDWAATPPDHPVILAGSTGSRGSTLRLMQAVANLPQGAVILPGFDFHQPPQVWRQMTDAMRHEDHPQYRFVRVMETLGLAPADIARWTEDRAASSGRNRLISLALRPAPFTDAWLDEGPNLGDLASACAGLTLVEAETPGDEALAIALRLRRAAEDGQSAALITPDRMLSRRVAAALDRWDIVPDDSAGQPLHLSPPGRLLRLVAQLFTAELTAEALVTLLKHPLTHGGSDRGPHLRYTRELELDLRRNGPPFPDAASLVAVKRLPPEASDWTAWIVREICGQHSPGEADLAYWVARLVDTAEAIAAGHATTGSGGLWEERAGLEARAVIDTLIAEAPHGGRMSPQDFADLLDTLLSGAEVRDRDAPYPGVMIWGTLEARVQGADLLILGGLNEGTWPEAPSPDPWLNRTMRHRAGLLLPERRIGLSAHDFQQAAAAPEVWLTRSIRSDEAETVQSRWVNRLTNLLGGLPENGGTDALRHMRGRGRVWLGYAEAMHRVTRVAPAHRPSPRPPSDMRFDRLSVTQVKTLIRDPYAVYARRILRLEPLDPLVREPDALLRGIVLHAVFENFVKATLDGSAHLDPEDFLTRCRETLDREVPWPAARRLWLGRMQRIADPFVQSEIARRRHSVPHAFETRISTAIGTTGVTLTGQADRIDRNTAGDLLIYDYKTGRAPTEKEQKHFDKQLLIEAALAEIGGFTELDPARVSYAAFLSLGSGFKEVPAPLADEPPVRVWAELCDLVASYLAPAQGFTSRRLLQKDSDAGDYDHLARFGEWDRSAESEPEDLA